MSEPRKNHLSIDGGQVKEDDHVASYKPIPDADAGFRTSKPNLSKSKEKVSDGAEEKLLQKEDEAKIVRVDMADAKYVVGDHRNGDAKIELDANKKQFSGLTKEELLKYADDPFWVNLRWCMFVLFWAMWLAMLAGAITIIIRAPKCAPPEPREWYEKWPLVETDGAEYAELEAELPYLETAKVRGIFVEVPTYDVDEPGILEKFQAFVAQAKAHSIKVIVDLTPNFVSTSHKWFLQSQNRSAPYEDYFVWRNGSGFDKNGNRKRPNNWVSTLNIPAWTLSEKRNQFYLHQYAADQADLNFDNEKVVAEFKGVLKKWMKAGAEGVRLNKVRQVLVNSTFADEEPESGRGAALGADHTQYAFYRHVASSDLPALDALLHACADLADSSTPGREPATGETVFTLKEEGDRAELFLLQRNITFLRPASAAPLQVRAAPAAAEDIKKRVRAHWPAIQLVGDPDAEKELALLSLLLPATPVLDITQIAHDANDTTLSDLVSLREDASIEHGKYSILAVSAGNSSELQLLACARWKIGHTGYIGVFNPTDETLRANLTSVPTVPAAITVHLMTPEVKLNTNYTKNYSEDSDKVLVPAKSTLILSYVPQTVAES